MVLKITVFLAIMAVAGTPNAHSEEDLDSVIDQVQSAYEKTTSFDAKFTQLAEVKSLGRKQKAEGIAYIKKPGKMRWNYLSPEKQFIISNSSKIWFYFPEDNQLMEEKVKDFFQSKSPLLFLTGKAKLRELFIIQFHRQPKKDTLSTDHLLEMTPRKQEATYRKIILKVRKKDYQIVGVTVEDLLGNTTQIQFQDVNINSEIDNSLFEFDPPKGVELLSGPTG